MLVLVFLSLFASCWARMLALYSSRSSQSSPPSSFTSDSNLMVVEKEDAICWLRLTKCLRRLHVAAWRAFSFLVAVPCQLSLPLPSLQHIPCAD